jgi:hypothetical protein
MNTTAREEPLSPILLESTRLKVEIAHPGTVYRRTRFDWTGFITQIRLDGKHTFCVPEDYNPAKGTGGIGLCGEFGIEKAIGYADAQPGEGFPKLGIGLLKRPDAPDYRFFVPHEILDLFEVRVDSTPASVRFTVEPRECRGYAVRQIKTLSVEGNRLTIAYHLENTGAKAIHTHEYCHNFLGIDNQPVGPDYRLRFAFPVKMERSVESFRGFLPPLFRRITPGFVLEMLVERMASAGVLRIAGREVGWAAVPEKAFFCRPLGFFQTAEAQWELTHVPSGVCVREFDDFVPARVALWGQKHVVSPEVYTDVDIEPGQSQSWTRRYEFEGG